MRLFLSGDVMTGRGIDQVLAHPSHPQLHEPYIRDARSYVALAESAERAVPKPVDDAFIWGDALAELTRFRPDVRIINLETSITVADEPWPEKSIHYRMHPDNVGCLKAAGIDCCCLANNHVLDWGRAGLTETLTTLENAGLRHAGAGRDRVDAERPAVVDVPHERRVLIFAFGSQTSGIPPQWAATKEQSGVWLLPDLSDATADDIAETMQAYRQDGDVLIAFIHWASNWGYDISGEQQRFAHRLIDGGIDLIHGHSSHHVKGFERYRNRLILYGCGDLITDYEGIGGNETFRGDLGLLYLPELNRDGSLDRLQLVPMQMRGFQLMRARPEDRHWLHHLLNRENAQFNTCVAFSNDGTLELDRS